MTVSGITPIAPLPPLSPISPLDKPAAADQAGSGSGGSGQVQQAGSDFAGFLSNALQQVDSLQKDADTATNGLVTGQIQDVHTVMIALQKANLAMSLTVEARNKVLDAYNEIMRMQL